MLGFLYMCPTGVVQTGIDGTIRLINPHASQLLMPVATVGSMGNLFTALQNCAPELRNLTEVFTAERGCICQAHRIFVGVSGPGPTVLSCSLLKINSDCLMAAIQDVSREVEQERQLRQNEALFAALAAGVNDFALLSLDVRGRIDTWNASGARQTGFDASEVVGRTLDVLIHSDSARRTAWKDKSA